MSTSPPFPPPCRGGSRLPFILSGGLVGVLFSGLAVVVALLLLLWFVCAAK